MRTRGVFFSVASKNGHTSGFYMTFMLSYNFLYGHGTTNIKTVGIPITNFRMVSSNPILLSRCSVIVSERNLTYFAARFENCRGKEYQLSVCVCVRVCVCVCVCVRVRVCACETEVCGSSLRQRSCEEVSGGPTVSV